jgi:hypothetical protein
MPHLVPSEVVRVIDKNFPWAAGTEKSPRLDINHLGRVVAVLALVDRLPAHLLTLNGTEYADYINAVEALRSRPQLWIAQPTISRSAEPVREIRNSLTKCPDDWPPATVHGLAFIADVDLRADLRRDIDHAQRALDGSEWKAATVLAGAVVESLLLWTLGTFPELDVHAAAKTLKLGIKPDIHEWHLPDYIKVAAIFPVAPAKPILTADTAKMLELVKNFRNLIHPGRAVRLQKQCDRDTALVAMAGVVATVRELS